MRLKVLLSAFAVFLIQSLPVMADGEVTPPFTESFSTQAGFNRFTVINVNGDTSLDDPDGTGAVTVACTWFFDTSRLCASYVYNKSDLTIGADDWLITPGLQLEAGRSYTLTFLAGCANNQGERMEVKLGTSATVAGMTQTIMPATDITDKMNFDDFTGKVYTFDKVSVTESGVYYIGFHAISPANHFRLMLDDIELTGNPFDSAPSVVTDFTVSPAAFGVLKAEISLKAPTTTVNGETLTSLNRIELKRGGELIHTFNRPEPGAVLTYTDENPVEGNNTYSAIPYNSADYGDAVEKTVYVGLDVPQRPLGAWAEDNTSSVTLQWDAVGETGVNGGYVDPSRVQYIIYSMEGGYVVDQLGTTSAGVTTFNYNLDTEAGTQELRQFAIAASNESGRSSYGVAALVTGQSYRLPFEEHFPNGQLQNYWYRQSSGSYEPEFDLNSSDGDLSCYKITATQAGAQVSFVSGKISLSGSVNPHLLFYHRAMAGSDAKLLIEGQKPNGDYEVLKTIDYSQLSSDDWAQEVLSLSNLKNERYVLVAFHFVSAAFGDWFSIDDVRVIDLEDFDLATAISAPAIVSKGTTAQVNISVINRGGLVANDYRVQLYANDELVYNELVADDLASQATRVFTVDYPVSALTSADVVNLRAVTVFDYDLDESNNEATTSFTVKGSGLPTAENFSGAEGDVGIVLTWNQPSTLSREYAEDFESDTFQPFDNGGITATNSEGSLGDWKLVDRDGQETYRLTSNVLFDYDGLQTAWYVFEPRLYIDLDNNPRVRPHSGNRYLMGMCAASGTTDDWLISPRLSGEEQEISFWASEYSASYDPEKFELYYSTTGPNILNMQYLGQGTITEERWTEQKFTVPAGTRYFAIRHVSQNGWGMMVDDFTYRVGAASIKQYNIYRDGELLVSINAQDPLRYVDQTTGEHVYHLTVVYSDGEESDAVAVTVVTSGIDVLPIDAARPTVVYDLQGRRLTSQPTKGVYLVNGRKVVVK